MTSNPSVQGGRKKHRQASLLDFFARKQGVMEEMMVKEQGEEVESTSSAVTLSPGIQPKESHVVEQLPSPGTNEPCDSAIQQTELQSLLASVCSTLPSLLHTLHRIDSIVNHNELSTTSWNTEMQVLINSMQEYPEMLDVLPLIAQHALGKYLPRPTSSISLPNPIPRRSYLSCIPNIPGLSPIFELTTQRQDFIQLTQLEIKCLLANAFFGVIPCRAFTFKPLFNANPARKSNVQKLRAIFHYFKTPIHLNTLVRFVRRQTRPSALDHLLQCPLPIGPVECFVDGLIEKAGNDTLHVDFANANIGGGVLGNGCVQEEIRFAINPELIVARLFVPKLRDNEHLLMLGSERFSEYTGYASSFVWTRPYVDESPINPFTCIRQGQIVAMDALNYSSPNLQYRQSAICRELIKAIGAFEPYSSGNELPQSIATGNWGCGAFRGDPELKFLIQVLAASYHSRRLQYYLFGNRIHHEEFQNLIHLLHLHSVTVGQLFKWLRQMDDFTLSSYDGSVLTYIKSRLLG